MTSRNGSDKLQLMVLYVCQKRLFAFEKMTPSCQFGIMILIAVKLKVNPDSSTVNFCYLEITRKQNNNPT